MNAHARRAAAAHPESSDPLARFSDTLDAVGRDPDPGNTPPQPPAFFRALHVHRSGWSASGINWQEAAQRPLKAEVMHRLDEATLGIEAIALLLLAHHASKGETDLDEQLGDYVVDGLHHALAVLAREVRNDIHMYEPRAGVPE